MTYDNNTGGKYGKNFIQDLQTPPGMITPEFLKFYNSFATRILWMDSNLCPGAFQMNTAWYHSVPERDPVFPEHEHPYAELVGFFGSNPDDERLLLANSYQKQLVYTIADGIDAIFAISVGSF